MADRVVKVSLVAQVNNYVANMEAAAKGTKKVTETLAQQKAASIEAAKRQGEAMEKVGKAAVTMGAVAAAGVAVAVKKFADFDAKMSQVKTLSHATGEEMAKLTDAALHMGQAIGFSATEVADAETELVKAGVSVKDIMGGGLVGALNLAAAGQIAVGQATEIASVALTQFKLQGKDVPHVADLLAAGADKALGGVEELGQALNQSGLVAAQFGLTIDDTVGTLSAFANAGLMGSDAGTSFKQMLLALGNPSIKSAATMKELGLSAYDAQGQFIGITGLAGQLQEKLKDLTPEARNSALAIIFGSDAVRSANVLYTEGAKGIQGWVDSVNDSGFAAHQAQGKMDNLKGDLSKLGAAFESDLIEAGGSANGVLRGLTQGVTGLLKAVGDVPQPVMAAGLALGGVVAAIGLVGGGALLAVPKIAAMKVAMKELGLTGKSLAKGLAGGLGVTAALTVLTVAASHMNDEIELSSVQFEKLKDAIDKVDPKKLDALFKGAEDGNSGAAGIDGFKDALNGLYTGDFLQSDQLNLKIGSAIDGVTGNIFNLSGDLKRFQAQFKEMGTELATVAETDFGKANDQFQKYIEAAGGGETATRQLLNAMPEYKAELIKLASAAGGATDDQSILNLAMGKGELAAQLAASSTKDNSAALEALSGKAQDAELDIDSLAKTIEGFASASLDSRSATREFEAAVDAATEAVDKNGSSLDVGTEKGRDNQAALDDIASSALNMSGKILTATGSQDKASAAIARGREELIKALGKFGITGKAAETYADKLGLIPENVKTAVDIETADAKAKVEAFVRKLNDIPGYREVVINEVIKQTGAPHGQVAAAYNADGGTIRGPGTGTSDSILSWLSNGEEVTRAAMAEKYRPLLKAINADRVGPYLSTAPRFATGGTVQPTFVRGNQYAQSAHVSTAAAPQVNVQVVSNGIDLTGYLDVVVDGKLQAANRAQYLQIGNG